VTFPAASPEQQKAVERLVDRILAAKARDAAADAGLRSEATARQMSGLEREIDQLVKSRRRFMADKVRVWFDAEADFLEVRFSDAAGYEKETKHDAVMERVDKDGHVVGFSILGVSRFKKDKPLVADLVPA
jgi:hypothetical protein